MKEKIYKSVYNEKSEFLWLYAISKTHIAWKRRRERWNETEREQQERERERVWEKEGEWEESNVREIKRMNDKEAEIEWKWKRENKVSEKVIDRENEGVTIKEKEIKKKHK